MYEKNMMNVHTMAYKNDTKMTINLPMSHTSHTVNDTYTFNQT